MLIGSVIKNPKYPVYIISKGRFDNPITAKSFLDNDIPFLMAIEPQEYDSYRKNIPERFLIKTPFKNLGLGSYPARNFCWDHSVEQGYKKHFIFDDNIRGFAILRKGIRQYDVNYLNCLNALADFTDKFENVAISGYNYEMFVTKNTSKAFTINGHVYSGMLIKNDIPYRWRLKYNEDVDICLQVLDAKLCTILLNSFLIRKVSTTAKMKGGNQDELYQGNKFEKKVLKSKSLEMVWPQYVKTVIKFNRPHHHVSWNKYFRHPLIKKKEIAILAEKNE